ncbi:MAG: twin-arginine translocation signal domain-containing protein [Gemmatimonadaceae bacterium]
MNTPSRRGFLGSVGALAGAAAIFPNVAIASESPQGGWDMSWLDRLTGKHRQVFDFANLEIGLMVVKNWYDAWETVYALKHPQLNAVVGIGGHAFPVNAGDELYKKFPIGEQWKVTDPATGKPALHNVFLDGAKGGPFAGAAVRPLQARGAIFWQCNNALNGVAAQLAAAVQRPQPDVYQELKAGLNPGVILVPAHTMLIGMCQEHGCSYESL